MDRKTSKAPEKEPSLKEQFSSRAFRAGTYSVVISLLAIAVVVILNLLVSKLPSKVTKIDLTDSDLLALSDQTKQLVSGLEEDVTVYQILENEGDEDEYSTELCHRYSDLSKHFKYETVNIILYPNFVGQYTSQKLYRNSLVVVSDKRTAVIDYFDIYKYTFADDSTKENLNVEDIQFCGEEKLTTAVDYVTTDVLPIAYYLTGHGEATMTEMLSTLIVNDNIAVRSLNLVQAGTVPEDCDCLIINGPTMDVTEAERDSILQYLEAGGNLLLVSDYQNSKGAVLPNVEQVMDYYGLTTKASPVFEGDSNHYYSSGLYILPSIETHDITSAITAGGYFVLVPISQPIYEKAQHRDSLTVEPLLVTTKEAYVKDDFDHRSTNEKEDKDEKGVFSLATAVSEEHDGVVTKLVWIGSGMLLDETINSAVSGTNNDFFLGSLGWMTGSKSSISIHSKSLTYEDLNVTAGASNFWSLLFVIIIPVVLLLCGGVILYRLRTR
jgi:ABC-2 type transport system permease protein